ncbi:hypothetical protein B4099_0812 [Heyndrickxia coagulans]|uniref:Uncharacterized protein n=1 Tax=Heyndrickxia coagulans TaxID=1398 RepID=A0A150KEB0_HEYCO|nr:hypothetical protein B4099_0812 [Heyndrickxia coagulans]
MPQKNRFPVVKPAHSQGRNKKGDEFYANPSPGCVRNTFFSKK